MRKFFRKIRQRIEEYIPMTLGNLVVFGFLVYLVVVVSQSVYTNYKSNQQIAEEKNALVVMRSKITELQNQINYDQTDEYKEMKAREKLGYMLVGETVIALPPDTVKEKTPDSGLPEVKIKQPNYSLWWQYFFGKK